MMQDLDPEEQFDEEPLESEQNESRPEKPVLSEPKTVHQEASGLPVDLESIPDGAAQPGATHRDHGDER
jgi:hypothetical protein